jgi:hypothetical protein
VPPCIKEHFSSLKDPRIDRNNRPLHFLNNSA